MVGIPGARKRRKFSGALGFGVGADGRGREGQLSLREKRIRPRLKGRAGNLLPSIELPQTALHRCPVLRHFRGGYGMSFRGIPYGMRRVARAKKGMARHEMNVVLTSLLCQSFL